VISDYFFCFLLISNAPKMRVPFSPPVPVLYSFAGMKSFLLLFVFPLLRPCLKESVTSSIPFVVKKGFFSTWSVRVSNSRGSMFYFSSEPMWMASCLRVIQAFFLALVFCFTPLWFNFSFLGFQIVVCVSSLLNWVFILIAQVFSTASCFLLTLFLFAAINVSLAFFQLRPVPLFLGLSFLLSFRRILESFSFSFS